jgi:DNA-directed RNA polymerase subunit RPC12/RpoP
MIIHYCLECGKELQHQEEHDLLCFSCNAKMENDLRLMEDDDFVIEGVFQII